MLEERKDLGAMKTERERLTEVNALVKEARNLLLFMEVPLDPALVDCARRTERGLAAIERRLKKALGEASS